MIKILILNEPTEIGIDIQAYFKSLDINFTYKILDVHPPLRECYTFPNGNICYTPEVLQDVRSFIKPFEYNYVIFFYNASDYPQAASTGGYTESNYVFPGTNLSTVRKDGNESHYAIHELHHLFANRLQFLGYPVKDYMDLTPVGNQWIPYYKDFGPEMSDSDSNHSQTWNQILPYVQHLGEFPPTMKQGMKNVWIKDWQNILNEKGYWYVSSIDGTFGPLTEKATKDLQEKIGATVDGIVGHDTLTKAFMIVKDKITLWCEAAIKMEGARKENNNPGNLRTSPYTKNRGATGDHNGFAVFPTYEMGYNALKELFTRACTGKSSNYHPDETLYEFYAGIMLPNRYGKVVYGYAPSSDGNTPNKYAEYVANHIGVSPTIQIKDLL